MFGAQQREKIYPELGSTSGELFFPTRRVDKNSSRLFSDNLRAGATVVRMIGVRRQLRQHETTLLLMESCYLLSLVVVGNKRRQLRQHVTSLWWMESCYSLSAVVVRNKRRQLEQHVTTLWWVESCCSLSLVVVGNKRRQLRQHETTLLWIASCYLLSAVVVVKQRRQLRQHVTTLWWMESCYLLSLVVVLSVHSLVFRIGRGKMTFGSSYSCCASRRSPVRMRQNSCSVRMVSKELRDAREQ